MSEYYFQKSMLAVKYIYD